MEWLLDPHAWLALATLTALEIVLGVDNIIFISILAGRLPEHQRDLARRLGLAFAMLTRIGLLLSLAWIMTLTAPLFEIPVLGKPISGRDLILIGVALIGEGWDLRIPKGYIYFAMAFAVAVEMLNLRLRARRAKPLQLRRPLPLPEKENEPRAH